MASNNRFAEVGALIGDPARASMLQALMDGRALTAGELSAVAGVTPQTASGHLARMSSGGLLVLHRQGRHRYYRLASPGVAHMLESIMQVAAGDLPSAGRLVAGPRDASLRLARTCYDHFAGRLGVAIADALIERGYLQLSSEGGDISEAGLTFLDGLGIDVAPMAARRTRRSGRLLCRPCLDWSERRLHIAGALGAAICSAGFANGWTRRTEGSRAVKITPKGTRVFREGFGIRLP